MIMAGITELIQWIGMLAVSGGHAMEEIGPEHTGGPGHALM